MQYMYPINVLWLKTQDQTETKQYFHQLITHFLCGDPTAITLGHAGNDLS